MHDLALLVIIIIAALIYDYSNGANDCANAIATTISTKALSPRNAILLAAFFNFVGAFITTRVAKTIGKGVLDPETMTLVVILAAIMGAAIWTIICSKSGIPISVTHALVGGLIGAGILAGGFDAINFMVVLKVVLAMIISPIAGFVGGFLLIILISWVFRRFNGHKVNYWFKKGQLLSATFMSISHGMNDAQNAMGIITAALFSYGAIKEFQVPWWVIFICAAAMGLGTAIGGSKVIKTMGHKVFKLKPPTALSAEIASASVITLMSHYAMPISTTHVTASGIMGSGSAQRFSAVRWGMVGEIVITWIITLPCAAIISTLCYLGLKLIF